MQTFLFKSDVLVSEICIYTEEALRNVVKNNKINWLRKFVEDFNKEKWNENFSVIRQHIVCAVKESAFANPLSKRLPLCAMVKHLRRGLWIFLCNKSELKEEFEE